MGQFMSTQMGQPRHHDGEDGQGPRCGRHAGVVREHFGTVGRDSGELRPICDPCGRW